MADEGDVEVVEEEPTRIDWAAEQKKPRHQQYLAAEKRRQRAVELLTADPAMSVEDICAEIGITKSAWSKWRDRFPEFRATIDTIRGTRRDRMSVSGWTGGFQAFRKTFFGFDSPLFHLDVIRVLETAKPGTVTLILMPPEHGKTTLLTDYISMRLALHPAYRVTFASGRQAHPIKVGNRIRNRMTWSGPCKEFVQRFGPMSPVAGSMGQPWGEKHFNVYKKGETDDQEYSFQALGIDANVVSTRCDDLYIDDVQSRKNINATAKIVETIRQDWLSRPGAKGRVFIVGTRVDDPDVYSELEDAFDEETGRRLVDNVVRYAAVRRDSVTNEPIYLWPERYSPEEYESMRVKAGPSAWARNYQQSPIDASTESFNEEVLDKASNTLRAWSMPIPADVQELAITLDPALGGQNAFSVQGWAPDKLYLLDTQGDWGLTSYDQITTILANLLAAWSTRQRADKMRIPITTLVIEDKAFQKGLPREQGILELQDRYGFEIVPHQTGSEKNDDVIGVTGMVRSMRMGEIEFPAATDPDTIDRIDPIKSELRRWRPRVRGNRLKQDRVMALWFGWLQWRIRRLVLIDPAIYNNQGPTERLPGALPWAPMPHIPLTGTSTGSPLRQKVS